MRTLALALCVYAACAATASSGAPPDRCATDAEVVLASPRVEIWATEPPSVCHRPTGRVTSPANEPPLAGFDRDRPRAARQSTDIAGDYVGYAWESPEDECGYSGIHLVNARTGEVGTPQIDQCGTFLRFRRVVVKRSGAIAWSERRSIVACRTACERDPESKRVVLARGDRVDTRSLRDARGGVRWREGKRWRTARLP